MSRNYSLGLKICAQIDWREVYTDFKNQHCTYKEYREGAFIEFLKRHGIETYVPCEGTFYRHFKIIREQEKAEAIARENESKASENKVSSELVENKNNAQHDRVDVFMLDDINDALTHGNDLISKSKGRIANPPLSSSVAPSSTTNHARNMGTLTTLEATWHGAVFKIPCINPEESLARLLVKLKVFEEKSNAHQL